MASCLSGASGGTSYGFNLDYGIKSTTSTTSTLTSSPSSTSSNTPLPRSIISTKKPRTLRKRPNQTYNEAATLLSNAYPNLFPTKTLNKPTSKFTKPITTPETNEESSEQLLLVLPFRTHDTPSFLLHQPFQHKPTFQTEPNKALQENPSSSSSSSSSCQIKKKKKVELELVKGNNNKGLMLKLNYDDVRNAWSDRGSPFAGKHALEGRKINVGFETLLKPNT